LNVPRTYAHNGRGTVILSLRATLHLIIARPHLLSLPAKRGNLIDPTEIASSLYCSQRQREEELSPVEKTAITGLLALVSVAMAVWVTRFRGSTGGSDSTKLQAVLKLH
jgi:hypothetical protein